MEERKRLIQLWETGWSPSELARRFGVSRPTVYAVIERWLEEGTAAFEERSRRPHSSPLQTSAELVAALLNSKDRYPHYGPDKLVRLLLDEGLKLSASTARDILRRNGRVRARRARPPRWSPALTPKIRVPGPGHSMSADHKGHFRMGDQRYCYPLTIADPSSRYVFAVEAHRSTHVAPALRVFERVFREWGLPEQIITDNGNPFCCSRSLGGLTELSKMWIKLGIQHVRIQPGRPQQNGIHERMHGTLKRMATIPPAANLARQQRRFDAFSEEFNHVRPHQALGQERPASRVQPYRRPYPERIPIIEYPSSFEVRSVRSSGEIQWKGELLFVSRVLYHERVALLHVNEHLWRVYFGPVHLATWNERRRKFEPPSPVGSEDLPASPPAHPPSPPNLADDDV
jgi:transposase InsO family protein